MVWLNRSRAERPDPLRSIPRLLWRLQLKLLTLAFAFLASIPLPILAQGKVYLVIGSDTAVWNVAGGVDVTKYRGHFVPDVYIQPQQNAYQVMDPAFRNRFIDSYGQSMKLTWWMMVGSVYLQCDSTDVPIPNLMPLYLMHKYHGDAMRQFGDEVSLHYHTFFWSDYDGDGKYYWNQARTFHESRPDFDFVLAQSLVEEEVFPASFRSGWHYMDNEWQAYLNLLLPFSLHNASPTVRADNVEPYDNVYDWSKAPLGFVPFHPSTTNYQVPGDGIGWNVRSVKMPSVTQTMFNQMFAQAAGGTNQVACFWAHLPEVDFLTNVAKMDILAHVAASNYPTVQFRYCTAVEAMQRWLGTTDHTPPQLDVVENLEGDTLTLTLSTSESIFQPQPFVATKDICERYSIVPCNSIGPNTWNATLPVPRSHLVKVGIAVTDPSGNLTTRVIRYLPDDIYIDNLDSQYSELSGSWTRTTNAAWGIDARVAFLADGDIAQARWSLPISRSGPHNVFVQMPSVTNAAGNVSFNLFAGGSNALSVLFTNLPGKEWIYLGSAMLDATASNTLEMAVSGASQAGTVARADVIRVSPLAPERGVIANVQMDPSDTTANITWSTSVPALTLLRYGQDLAYENSSSTNATPMLNHVVTLTGLIPNTVYNFQIDAAAGEGQCPVQYSFKTANFSAMTRLFDVTNSWKYSTNQLDGVNWQTRDYNDAAWRTGQGLLWVDTRSGGPNSVVQPKGTQMPINKVTGFPFVTYYFRTHFNLPDNMATTGLSFSNYIDDGAVFYLNGVEIYRQNMALAPTIITNASLATASNCSGDATCPVLFNIGGALLTNLLSGDNLLAVEVHNSSARNSDVTFGSALSYSHPVVPPSSLKLLRSGEMLILYWNGTGWRLQEANGLSLPATPWTDVPGPVTNSPYFLGNSGATPATRFYRLQSP